MRRPLVEEADSLAIRDACEAIPQGASFAILEIGTQCVSVIGRETNLHKGRRYFFLCSCGKPCEYLYRRDFSEFRCRHCIGLVYASSMKVHLATVPA